ASLHQILTFSPTAFPCYSFLLEPANCIGHNNPDYSSIVSTVELTTPQGDTMAATEFVCPQCKAHAASPKAIPVGAMVRCPKCSLIFKYEGQAAKDAEPAKPAE